MSMKNMAHVAPVTKLKADVTLLDMTTGSGVFGHLLTVPTKAESAISEVFEVIDLAFVAIPLEEARAQGSSKALLRLG
jgi:hypothetical protein